VILRIDDHASTKAAMQKKSPALPHHCIANVSRMVGQRWLPIVVESFCNSGGWFQGSSRLQFACLTHPTFFKTHAPAGQADEETEQKQTRFLCPIIRVNT
jgi:hypothetical protein